MSDARPLRVRAAPAVFDDEQAAAVHLAQLAAQLRNPAAAIEVSNDSSDESDAESGPEDSEERKDNDVRPPAFPWSTQHSPIRPLVFAPPRLRRTPPAAASSPRDFFHLFLPESYLQQIVNMTNAYAQQQRLQEQENEQPNVGDAQQRPPWQVTSLAEVRAILGCLIYMGIVCMDSTYDYWAEQTRQAFVADCFPRDRFVELLRALRVSEEAEEGDERLAKLHQLIGTLESTLLQYFYPSRHVCIDEAMAAFVASCGSTSQRRSRPRASRCGRSSTQPPTTSAPSMCLLA